MCWRTCTGLYPIAPTSWKGVTPVRHCQYFGSAPACRPVNASWDILKTLSDPTRLRLLALLMREELSVAELQEILGMGQSRISSQLALLRQVNLVSDRREGKKAFYSLRTNLPPRSLALLKAATESVSELPLVSEDRDNLERILQKRRRVSEQYFNL